MPSTSRGYPYPSGSDDVDIPGDMQALAAAVNTDVGAVRQLHRPRRCCKPSPMLPVT